MRDFYFANVGDLQVYFNNTNDAGIVFHRNMIFA